MFTSARFIDLCCVFTILSTLSMSTDGIRQMRLAEMRNRMISRRLATLEENSAKVCFDMLGCFVDRQSPPVKRAPQHPNVIKTQFFLYTRTEREHPEVIKYGDNFESIKRSKFNVSHPFKIIVHGYKGSGNDVGAIRGANALLEVQNANVVIVDWALGANGPYGIAVSNVELVGRQLALIILDAIKLGIDPNTVHIVGFSLGAHIAGCASEMLKKRNILLGRITGLDPASPFFRNRIFRERSRKLDASDAKLVDVVHTDGSIDFADGFGLFKPIGHVDFFPNGGREQPGCTDIKNAVVVSHLNEDLLDKDTACSHLRAWALFVESVTSQLESGCKFTSWPCPQGASSFTDGSCFPPETEKWSQEMGYAADRGPLGIYYVVTRHEPPFCGDPLRIAVETLDNAPQTNGVLYLKIQRDNSTATFQVHCNLPDEVNGPFTFYGLVATEFRAFVDVSRKIEGSLWYQPQQDDTKGNNNTVEQISPALFLSSILIEDRKGNRWSLCQTNFKVDSTKQFVGLQSEEC